MYTIYENINPTPKGITAAGTNRKIKPNIKAKDKFDKGPAKATFMDPHFLSLKLNGLIGTGLAHPNIMPPPLIWDIITSKTGTNTDPTGSKCFKGFKVRRPAYFAVLSPKLYATAP